MGIVMLYNKCKINLDIRIMSNYLLNFLQKRERFLFY